MSKRSAIGWVSAVVVTVAGIAWLGQDGEPADAILENRVWLDKVPSQRDENAHVALFQRGGEDAGDWDGSAALATINAFKGDFERFRWRMAGAKKLELHPLPKGATRGATFEARACKEEGFQYCLEITGLPRGPKTYRSKRGWEVEPGDADGLERALSAARAELTAE
jgi:hypothetical protein